jgi:hypothetical protein
VILFMLAVEGGVSTASGKLDRERRIRGARRLYGTMLACAAAYDGADVGAIIYKSTEAWTRENCCVPSWLKLMHCGDVTGTNALQHVRALFVIGRLLPSGEDMATGPKFFNDFSGALRQSDGPLTVRERTPSASSAAARLRAPNVSPQVCRPPHLADAAGSAASSVGVGL